MISPPEFELQISVVSGDHERASAICEQLDSAGAFARPAEFDDQFDAVLFDLATCKPELIWDMSEYARDCGPGRPLLATLGHFPSPDIDAPPVDVRLSTDAALSLAPIRLHFARRVLARRAESALRRETLESFGQAMATPRSRQSRHFLYLGDASAMFPSLERRVQRRGDMLSAAFSGYTAFDYLHEGGFDAVVLDSSAPHIRADMFCDMISRSPTLIDTPLLVLVDGDQPVSDTTLRVASDLIDRSSSVDRVFDQLTHLASESDQAALVRQTPHGDVADPETGLFSRQFFETHLRRQVEWARDFDQPLSLMIIRFHEDAAASTGRALGHAARLLKSLLRSQDTPARMNWSTLLVSLPGADIDEALRAAGRVGDVMDATAFESELGQPPQQVSAECRVLQLEDGQDAHGFLADALALGPRRRGAAA